MIKVYGEKGSPCLIPFVGVNNPCGSSLTTPNKKLRRYIFWSSYSMFDGNIFLETFRNKVPFYPVIGFFHIQFNGYPIDLLLSLLNLCIISWVMRILSWIDRPGIKALWKGKTILSSSGCNRFTSILAMILQMVEHRLIGLNWFVCVGFSILGIRAINVWLISFKILSCLKNSRIQLNKSFFTRCQYCLKKPASNRSAPRVLLELMLNNAFLTLYRGESNELTIFLVRN